MTKHAIIESLEAIDSIIDTCDRNNDVAGHVSWFMDVQVDIKRVTV